MTRTDGQTTTREVRECPVDTVVRVHGPVTPLMPGRVGVVAERAEAPWLAPGQMAIRLLSPEDPREDSWLTLPGTAEVEVLHYPKDILAAYARRVAADPDAQMLPGEVEEAYQRAVAEVDAWAARMRAKKEGDDR